MLSRGSLSIVTTVTCFVTLGLNKAMTFYPQITYIKEATALSNFRLFLQILNITITTASSIYQILVLCLFDFLT